VKHKVFLRLFHHQLLLQKLQRRTRKAIILSGGPSSVYADHAPKVDPAIFGLNIPVFGICYGFQTMAAALAGVVAQTGKSEFGRTPLSVKWIKSFAGLPDSQSVWMSHGDAVSEVPAGFTISLHRLQIHRLQHLKMHLENWQAFNSTQKFSIQNMAKQF
jgi:GMP synthase (glutamine-hydrolysing)